MSEKFLDQYGLAYFWSKIKSYVAGLLGAKADDSDVVHKTGTESINGVKTFLEGVTVTRNSNSNARYLLASGNIEKGNTLPDAVKVIGNLQFSDEQGHYFGQLTCDVDENGTFLNLIAYNFTDVDTYTAANIIKLAHFHNGTMAAYTNPPPANSVGSEIVTASWVRNHLSGSYVDTSNNQTIYGLKTFKANVTVTGLELQPAVGASHGGYVDFHYAGSSADFTSRIIESASGVITLNNFIFESSQLKIKHVNNGRTVFLRNDGSTFYLLVTDANDPNGSYNSLRPFWWNFSDSSIHSSGSFRIHSGLPHDALPSADRSIGIDSVDSQNALTHQIIFHRNTAGFSLCYLRAYCYNDRTKYAELTVGYNNSDDTKVAYAPRPIASSDNNSIATTNWVRALSSISDERVKTGIEPVDGRLLDVWSRVSWAQFKLNDSVSEKGDFARLHTGVVAQHVQKICGDAGVDISKYGLFCYDEKEDLYSIRYRELLCVEAAYQRRENARLKKRVADLEERLAALELRLGSD